MGLGMARPPLIPDRFWRFICWSGAAWIGVDVATVLGYLSPGRHMTLRIGLIAGLAIAYFIEWLLEPELIVVRRE